MQQPVRGGDGGTGREPDGVGVAAGLSGVSKAACRVRAVFFAARMAQAAESSCEVPQQIGMLLLGVPKLYYSERKCLTFFEGSVE